MKTMREEVFGYIQKKYKAKPEYLWAKFPEYAVFRHDDNQKWFGLVMNISYDKINRDKSGMVDILNVKLDDILLRDLLVQQDGYYVGYHISRGNWISIVLDGTVPLDAITHLIDVSYNVTASKKTKQKIRPPKEWLIPSNPKYYDIVHAFDNADVIDWKQGTGIKKNDTVFLYVGAPVSAILYQCKVTDVDIPYDYHSSELTITKLMKIKLIKRYKPEQFTFEQLKANYNSSTRDTLFSEYPEILDTKQLCQALGCSEKYVYKLIREGKLPKLKGIRSVRVPKVFLINFVLQGAQESGE